MSDRGTYTIRQSHEYMYVEVRGEYRRADQTLIFVDMTLPSKMPLGTVLSLVQSRLVRAVGDAMVKGSWRAEYGKEV